HAQYVTLPLERQAQVIARSRGPAGPNRDYLHATAERLRGLGLPDPELDWLDARVRALTAEFDAASDPPSDPQERNAP
ncbi:MAG: gamma-glutamylcyclotransferase, partial [Pseudomonadota bacterium]